MNWKLIFLLSLFGLAMAFATVFWIPTRFEPFCWLAIFAFCAWTVAKRVEAKRSKLFLHGFMISILNGLWITAVHLWFVQIYLDLNPEMQQMYDAPVIANHPRLSMGIMGLTIGVISGVILGFFCQGAARLMQKE